MTSQPVSTSDYHTAGEPFGIFPVLRSRCPGTPSATAGCEPSRAPTRRPCGSCSASSRAGTPTCTGASWLTDDGDADLGVLFWHKDGLSTACGHGTIALGTWAVGTGLVPAPDDGSVDVVIDVPSGRVTARVHRHGARTVAVDFVNVPSYVLARDVPLGTSGGEVAVTLAGRPAVVPQVTGLAHRTGEHTFLVDPADPLVPGFVLR